MPFPDTVALQTQPFETTRRVLQTIDNYAFEPLCQIEILSAIPRVVQAAINAIGLLDGVLSSAVLSAAAFAPLPESLKEKIRVWRSDAWSLTSQLADKVARLLIAAIPLIGTKILCILDHSLDTNDRLNGEIDSLRATGRVHDREIARQMETVNTLRHEIAALREAASTKIEAFVHENEALRAEKEGCRRGFEAHIAQLLREAGQLIDQRKHQEESVEQAVQQLHTVEGLLEHEIRRSGTLRHELSDTNRSLQDTSRRLEEAKKIQAQLQERLQSSQEEELKTKRALEQAAQRLSETERAASRLEINLQGIGEDMKRLRAQNAALTAENQRMHTLRSPSPDSPSRHRSDSV